MKNKIITAVMSLILVLGFSACSLSEAAASQPNEITPSPVNTEEVTPSPASTPSPTVSRRTEVSEDIKAQDACVLAYFDALKKNDADKIIQISSGNMFGEVYINAIGSDFIGELQSITATSDLMRTTWQFIYSILSDYDNTGHDSIPSKENIDEFVQEVDPVSLADIEVLEFGTPLEQPQVPDGLQLSISVISQRYCLFSIGGKTFCQLFWLVKSSDGYRLVVIGKYNGYSFNGYAKPISKELFEALVGPETIHEPSQESYASIPKNSGETTYLQKIKDTTSPSLNSPEEGIDCLAEALASRDTYVALRVFDIKERAVNYDLYYSAERLNYFQPYNDYCMTPEYNFYQDINIAVRCTEAAKGILSLIFGFGFDFDLKTEPSTVEYLSAIQKGCDGLGSLSVIRSGVIEKSVSEKMHNLLLEQVAVFGAEDAEHRIIEYNFNGAKFTGAIAFISYGGNWRIQELSSVLIPIPATVPVIPSSELDYDSYI